MAEAGISFAAVRTAIAVGLEINKMIEAARSKNGALREVKQKIGVVNTVLDLVMDNIQSVESDIMVTVLEKLRKLSDEVQQVKSMNRFVYILRAKDCQENLRAAVGEVQFYLNSLQFNQTNSIYAQTEEIKNLLSQGWNTVQENRALQTKLQKERKQAAKLKGQVKANKLTIQELNKFGLYTQLELEEARKQVEQEQKRMQAVEDAKNRLEAAYLTQVIQMLQTNLIPEPTIPFNPLCPISLQRLEDPVILDCRCKGTVSRSSFKQWLQHQTASPVICPVCGCPLLSMVLVPNKPIQEWLEANPLFDDPDVEAPVPTVEPGVHPEQLDQHKAVMPLVKKMHKPHHNPDPGDEPIVYGLDHQYMDPADHDVEVPPSPYMNPVEKPERPRNPDPPVSPVPIPVSEQLLPEWDPMPDLMPDPVPVPGRKTCCTVWRYWIPLLLLLLIGAIVGIVIAVTGGSNPEPTVPPVRSDESKIYCQMGLSLVGEAAGDQFGIEVAVGISSDGNRVAVGAPFNDAKGQDTGQVRIFDWSGSQWVQTGSNLDGEAAGDFVSSVALSSDGNRVAIGAPGNASDANAISGYVRMFDFSGSDWRQVGIDLAGEASGDAFGASVAISSDGNRVAVGAPRNDGVGENAGRVRVFDWSGSQWVQVGNDLDGEAAGDRFGGYVALSADGNRVAVGAPYNDGVAENAGHARIFDWSEGQWVQLGSDLDGKAAEDHAGSCVALSADGNRVALSATQSNMGSGYVQIFDWSDNQWLQVGLDLDGEAVGDGFGWSFYFSGDGNRIAVGAPNNDGVAESAGHVRIFDWSGSQWEQFGSGLDGEVASDWFGGSVDLSSDGNRVAIGSSGYNHNGNSAGRVAVYNVGNACL